MDGTSCALALRQVQEFGGFLLGDLAMAIVEVHCAEIRVACEALNCDHVVPRVRQRRDEASTHIATAETPLTLACPARFWEAWYTDCSVSRAQ
jgi:hypothetical protein